MKAGKVHSNERGVNYVTFLVRTVGACNVLVQFALVPPFKVGYLVAGSQMTYSTLVEKLKAL